MNTGVVRLLQVCFMETFTGSLLSYSLRDSRLRDCAGIVHHQNTWYDWAFKTHLWAFAISIFSRGYTLRPLVRVKARWHMHLAPKYLLF